MSKTETVAIIAAILAASDDIARTIAKVDGSDEPARFVRDAFEIYGNSHSMVAEDEGRKRYGA